MNFHIHSYKCEAKVTNRHNHKISGYTSGTIGINALHFHYFRGVSSYNGHNHYYSGITGLPIKTEYGHKHKIEGFLKVTNFHGHKFEDFTFEEITYIFQNTLKKSFV